MARPVTIVTAAKYVSAVGGAAIVAGQLLGHMDTALVKHLDSTFATKADIQRIEDKIDRLVEAELASRPKPSKK